MAKARGVDARRYADGYRAIRRAMLSFGAVCALCGKPAVPGNPLTVGHIVPLSRGGTNHPANLRVEHRAFNLSKGNRLDGELPGIA